MQQKQQSHHRQRQQQQLLHYHQQQLLHYHQHQQQILHLMLLGTCFKLSYFKTMEKLTQGSPLKEYMTKKPFGELLGSANQIKTAPPFFFWTPIQMTMMAPAQQSLLPSQVCCVKEPRPRLQSRNCWRSPLRKRSQSSRRSRCLRRRRGRCEFGIMTRWHWRRSRQRGRDWRQRWKISRSGSLTRSSRRKKKKMRKKTMLLKRRRKASRLSMSQTVRERPKKRCESRRWKGEERPEERWERWERWEKQREGQEGEDLVDCGLLIAVQAWCFQNECGEIMSEKKQQWEITRKKGIRMVLPLYDGLNIKFDKHCLVIGLNVNSSTTRLKDILLFFSWRQAYTNCISILPRNIWWELWAGSASGPQNNPIWGLVTKLF